MSTNFSSPNFLLQITLYKTTNPTVNRMLSVPSQMTFAELHEAIAAAFGWTIEPCTSWIFKTAEQNPSKFTKRDAKKKQKSTFTALWTALDHGYSVTPAQYGMKVPIGQWMGKANGGKYWNYDYNISRYSHAIEVMENLISDPARKLVCTGGIGGINRNAWQFADLTGLESKVKAGSGTWMSDIAALNVKLGEIQGKFEERMKVEAALAAEPNAKSKKRAALPGSTVAEADGVNVVAERAVKKNRVRGPAKVKAEAKVKKKDSKIKKEAS